MTWAFTDFGLSGCPKCGAIAALGQNELGLVSCSNGHSFTKEELKALADAGPGPEPGTVKEVEQDFEPSTASAEQAAAWAKKRNDEAIDAFVASVQPPTTAPFGEVIRAKMQADPELATAIEQLRNEAHDYADSHADAPDAPDAEAVAAKLDQVCAPAVKRWAVRLTNHGTLLIDAPDAEAAKAEYNRQRGIIKSDHAYSIEPVTEG